MRKKSYGRGAIPLEWRTQAINVTDTTTVSPSTADIDLDLLPDEIAEIYSIDSTIEPGNMGEVDNIMQACILLSLDPDSDDSPIVNANLLDIEVFYYHRMFWQLSLTTSGQVLTKLADNKQWNANGYPILVGTNIGMVFEAESTVDVDTEALVTVYFKRRKANAQELNQILLKRR